ncbi:YaeQ family protein [Cupriavidus basilensis]|uniref:YaeQ family protein n=1 Tax=Cupriavidus basilensis TaxID=68895 RepID=A0A0C4YC16_9BURK|nr:YaeQ family protein [Cupriavidus basilensis]AJG20473.1 YaeQ protein [Cupriavidus basilensis]MCP3019332.1 YaeQ family protein [Cupriavidus basilensis]MDR3380672.1 YaeQ family protein [Cupriavidus basilensis]QOT75531.1 YaeQ family protein [Cupriavidus basilensis]
MALKSTIYKAELSVSDMDRPYYGSHALTIAKHPSENDARMMVRLLAFACEASDTLTFTRGLDEPDEPDLWEKTLTGDIAHWIELGQPDESRLKRAAARADRVTVFTYNGASAREWWKGMAGKAGKLRNVTIYNVPAEAVEALAALAQRAMRLSVTIQDSEIWVSDDDHNVRITLEVLQQPAG